MPYRRELALACLILVLGWTGCGTSTTSSEPPAITMSVSPASASVQTGNTQQFTATVSHATDTAVTWRVNGVAGGDATVGTISSGGLYTAPASVPAPATVTVTAVSHADSSKSGSASVTVTAPPAVAVTVTPPSANLTVGAAQQFTAAVSGAADTSVTWSTRDLSGAENDPAFGAVSATGLYTAPATVPSGAFVYVVATSHADSSKRASAEVTIQAAGAKTRFAYVSSFPDNKIAIFSVDDSTGLLTPGSTVSTPANSNPSFLAMHPSGKFLYSLNKGTSNISIFSIDSASGALTSAGTAATDAGPHYMVFSPDGSHAYVTCDTASSVVAFSVNTSTGALTAVSGSPYAIGGGHVRGLAITPDNKYLYAADRDATPSAITGFVIDSSTGALTKMAAPFAGDFIGTLIVDAAGKFLYAGTPDSTVVGAYSINASTGALAPLAAYQAGTGSTSVWMFDPSGAYLYGGSTATNDIFGFKENADGSLTAMSGMPVSVATLPNGGGMHPNGKFAYAVSTISEVSLTPGTITIYGVDASTGAFTQISSMTAGVNNTIGFAITP